jgi:hypothetical protein
MPLDLHFDNDGTLWVVQPGDPSLICAIDIEAGTVASCCSIPGSAFKFAFGPCGFPRSPKPRATTNIAMGTVDDRGLPQAGAPTTAGNGILTIASVSPNPTPGQTSVRFSLPVPGRVRGTVHDVRGRLIQVFVDQVLPSGHHTIEWDGRDSSKQAVAAGIYMVRVEAEEQESTAKVMLIK